MTKKQISLKKYISIKKILKENINNKYPVMVGVLSSLIEMNCSNAYLKKALKEFKGVNKGGC